MIRFASVQTVHYLDLIKIMISDRNLKFCLKLRKEQNVSLRYMNKWNLIRLSKVIEVMLNTYTRNFKVVAQN